MFYTHSYLFHINVKILISMNFPCFQNFPFLGARARAGPKDLHLFPLVPGKSVTVCQNNTIKCIWFSSKLKNLKKILINFKLSGQKFYGLWLFWYDSLVICTQIFYSFWYLLKSYILFQYPAPPAYSYFVPIFICKMCIICKWSFIYFILCLLQNKYISLYDEIFV